MLNLKFDSRKDVIAMLLGESYLACPKCNHHWLEAKEVVVLDQLTKVPVRAKTLYLCTECSHVTYEKTHRR